MNEGILRCEVDGADNPRSAKWWTGVALTYLANLCAILALAVVLVLP